MVKKKPRSFHLTDELNDEIARRAALDGRSRSDWLQRYLEGQLLARIHHTGTEAPILTRQPHCGNCGHAETLHDEQGCTVGVGITDTADLCSCTAYQEESDDV